MHHKSLIRIKIRNKKIPHVGTFLFKKSYNESVMNNTSKNILLGILLIFVIVVILLFLFNKDKGSGTVNTVQSGAVQQELSNEAGVSGNNEVPAENNSAEAVTEPVILEEDPRFAPNADGSAPV